MPHATASLVGVPRTWRSGTWKRWRRKGGSNSRPPHCIGRLPAIGRSLAAFDVDGRLLHQRIERDGAAISGTPLASDLIAFSGNVLTIPD